MYDLQSITPPPSSNLTFGEFVQNVANSNPQIGCGFMGNVSFATGLPNGLTNGTMTVISYGEGFIKFSLDVENTPNHYECYRLSDGSITEWTIGQGGGGETELMKEVTYSELKKLRDNGELIPGMKYRITDYECSTSQEYTQSASNMFDIIVTADDEHTLNENARACKRDWEKYINNNVSFEQGDSEITIYSNIGEINSKTLTLNPNDYHSAEEGYDLYGDSIEGFFILVPKNVSDEDINCWNVYIPNMGYVLPDYGVYSTGKNLAEYYLSFIAYFDKSNLSAWELKYCLDNDTSRFAWAVEGEPGEYYHLVEIVGTDTKDYTFRTIYETEDYWSVYNINDPSVVGYIKPKLDPVTDSNFILYTDERFDDEYGEPYGKNGDEATVKEITLVDNPGTPSGKGVIYYMKDEWGNECPYDFKNIMFYDYATSKYYYTFDKEDDTDGTISNSLNFRNNRIDKYSGRDEKKYLLNNIIFVGKAINNTFANDCHDCKFDASLESCCFGEGCNYITTNNVSVIRNLVFGNNVNNLRISSDDTFTGVSDGWIFDANTFIEGYSVEITLPDSLTLYDYTENKRVTKTTSDKIIAIQEYMDNNYTIQTDVTLLYPSGGRGGVIVYNSNSEITGDWIDTNTDTTQNTYNSETGDGTLQLNEGVDEIGGEVTRQGLREMTINSPFYMNTDVRSVDMTNSGIVSIGEQAFNGCTNLSSVIISNTVTKIDKMAFADCPLNSVDIPDSVVFIDNLAFSTTTININYNGSSSGSPWGAQYVNADTDVKSGLMFGDFDSKVYSCSVIGCLSKSYPEIIIPSTIDYEKSTYSVTTIKSYAFRNCTNIQSVTIPVAVETLGEYIFDGCYVLSKDGKMKVSTIQSVKETSSTVPTTKDTFADDVTIPNLYVPTEESITYYTKAWGAYFANISTQKKNNENSDGSEQK